MRAREPRMWMGWCWVALAALLALILPPSNATLSPAGINYEVVSLMAIRAELENPCSGSTLRLPCSCAS